MPRPAILMFGATGQVAREALRRSESTGFDIVALGRRDVNLTDADAPVTWRGFAEEIFARMARNGRTVPDVVPVATADYPTAAARPANSALGCSRIATAYGIPPADWRAALDRDLASILEQQEAT